VFNGTGSVVDFEWENALTTMGQAVPTLYAAVTASMPKKWLDKDKKPTYV